MKKAIALLMTMLLPLFFFSCQSGRGKEEGGVPVIQTSFTQNAVIKHHQVEYPCQISRTDTADLVITMLEGAPNAGVVYACSANNTMITLAHMTYTLSPEEVRQEALIFTMTSLFNALTRVESLQVSRQDGGFRYEGSCKAGDFVVTQRSDGAYDAISIGEYLVEFA